MSSAVTVRWSLTGAPEGIEQRLRDYVRDTSHAKFSTKKGLRFKTWRMREGEWFEGCYVFVDDAARAAFQEEFGATAADSPVSVLLAREPELIEECQVVAVAEGPEGFTSAPSYDEA
jgi:hypothetical protein